MVTHTYTHARASYLNIGPFTMFPLIYKIDQCPPSTIGNKQIAFVYFAIKTQQNFIDSLYVSYQNDKTIMHRYTTVTLTFSQTTIVLTIN